MALPYAEVCVNSPAARREPFFSYSIPQGLDILPGHAVWVPFGSRLLQGIVIALSQYPSVESVRPIDSLIEARPLLSANQIEAALWISRYYLTPLFEAIALFLPPGFERRTLTWVSLSDSAAQLDIGQLDEELQRALDFIRRQGKASLGDLEREMGKMAARKAVSRLANRGLINRDYQIEAEKIRPKTETLVRMLLTGDKLAEAVSTLNKKRAYRQAALLGYMGQQTHAMPLGQVIRDGYSRELVTLLAKQELLKLETLEVSRQPIDYQTVTLSSPLTLTAAQRQALSAVRENLSAGNPQVFLLHGVTGSGKTEVYLQALAEAVKLGKKGMVLVPEIALTPQTIERFAGRFPGRVAVLHSRLSLGEQYDQWRAIKNGDYDVVIGARGAIFAPLPNPGIIILDEEHEWTYKQQEHSPRYHARAVALKLAELNSATVILGSATPDVESYYHARRGAYRLLELPQRLTPYPGAPMPAVELVDLKDELKAGNRSIFSRALEQAIGRALAANEQVILFYNRRGSAPFVQCRNCGLVVSCRRCRVAMSYHSTGEMLVCHRCNYHQAVPQICPRCSSRRIKYLGLGTQKLEEETAKTFPQARILRWDSDSTRGRHSHDEIMAKLRLRQADILIGTQMVAKGLDLPGVTLVGVVSADTALNLPDFRAGEHTFQLLSQVAGRAGRGEGGGRVIIQTYSPEHYAIKAVPGHNYALFYEQEIEFRRSLGNPPFSQLAQLVYSHVNETTCQREAERLKCQLVNDLMGKGIVDIKISGPAPAFVARLRGRYRWQLILKGKDPACLVRDSVLPADWAIDIDPLGV
jgi:primosomal protein N' (replication factor Y)